jgi:hypothetical protein
LASIFEDDEDIDGDDDSEVEMWRAREFEQSERRFDGRKERIEQIMSKVGTCKFFLSPPSFLLHTVFPSPLSNLFL